MATCQAPAVEARTGPEGFEVVTVPCGGTLTVRVEATTGVYGPEPAVRVTCSKCQTPQAPWLETLKTDPRWVLSMALTHWLDGPGQDLAHTPF